MMVSDVRCRFISLSFAIGCAVVVGCQTAHAPNGPSISEKLQQPRPRSSGQERSAHEAAPSNNNDHPSGGAPIATVNGRTISADRFNKLLLVSHGLEVLEQMIALELVKDWAAREGIGVSSAQIDAEYDRSIQEIARAVSDTNDLQLLQQSGEDLLREFLQNKNLSRAEYMISIERNAYLYAMVKEDVVVGDEEVKAEFERRHGRKAVIRHIVLTDIGTLELVRERIEAGEDFSELAGSYSVHRLSGSAGGLLPPFTAGDPQVPRLLRQQAFGLLPGEISAGLKIDGQFHLIRLERFIEPTDQPLRESHNVGQSLSQSIRRELRDHKIRVEMQVIERKLFEAGDIRILDSALNSRFKQKYSPGTMPGQ